MIRLWLFSAAVLVLAAGASLAADALPAKPAEYVADRAGVLSAKAVADWNTRLADYERDTSNQVLVAIFPSVPDGYAMEDFTQRTAAAWRAGQKTNNGVVFFIFPNDHKMRIEVGYGLEGAIPDATAKAILDNEVRPALRAGSFDEGVSRGLEAIMAAARGEYHGTGRTSAENVIEIPFSAAVFLIIIVGLVIFGHIVQSRQGTAYRRRGGRRKQSAWSPGGSWGGSGWSGGSSSGGWSGGSSDSGGGFSGGGGDFGGGGASGSW